jgi:hypothetical protein
MTTAVTEGHPDQDLAELVGHLRAIVEDLVNQHMQWMEGFTRWASQMAMSMQIVPPQAYAESEQRERWLRDELRKFEPIAEIIKRNGEAGLSDLLANYAKGFDMLSAQRADVHQQMAREDADTQRAIAGISARMAADNLKAGADRLKLQQETAAYVQTKTAEGIAKQQESFGKMNDAVRSGLFGR